MCGQCGAEVLEQERHSRERAGLTFAQHTRRVERGGLGAAALEQVRDHRVEVARRLNPQNRRLEQLGRGEIACREQLGLADRVDVGELNRGAGVHACHLSWRLCSGGGG